MINIEVKDAEIQKKLESLVKKLKNLKPAFGVIGEELIKNHRKRFKDEKSPEGKKWQPLKPETIARKKKNKDKILSEEGDLARLLFYRTTNKDLKFGSNRIYAAVHQFGYAKKNIPARPFLGVSKNEKAKLIDTLKATFKD